MRTVVRGGTFSKVRRYSRELVLECLDARIPLDGTAAYVAPPVELGADWAEVASRQAEGEQATVPNFSLTDVNPASSTGGAAVTPLSLRGKVTGWYFTHST